MRLTDICDFQGGSQPPKDEWLFEKQEGYIRMLQIRDFTQSEKVVPEYVKISKSTKICQADDILIARYGASIGKILTGLSGAYNVAIMRAIPDTHMLQKKYLYYYLKSPYFQTAILNVGSRAAQTGFNKEDLSKLEIKCPLLSEQDSIIDILQKVESIIGKRKKELIFLDELVKARFVELFGDPVKNDKGWRTLPLEDSCKSIVDCPHSTPAYTTEYTGYMCIRTSIIKKNKIMWDEVEYISEEEFVKRIQRKKPEVGDVVYTREGAILGIAAIIDRKYNVALGQRLMLLSPDTNKCISEFLCVAMNCDSFLNNALKGVAGSASPHINVGDIKMFRMIMPPIELQNQVADFVKRIDKSKVNYYYKNRKGGFPPLLLIYSVTTIINLSDY